MTGLYTLTVVTDFSASHIIPGHPGKCARLHGHNWKVEISVQARQLDHLGMGVDFAEIKQAAHLLVSEVDHQHLNDIPPFDQLSPTAENIAAWLFKRLAETLNSNQVTVNAVTLWETDRSRVTYSEM